MRHTKPSAEGDNHLEFLNIKAGCT